MQPHSPTPDVQRLVHLDILRGFALLGILLVNFQWFTRPMLAIYLIPNTSLTGLDLAVDWIITWLGEGKFYPLFSLMFGMGFALMADRSQTKDSGFLGYYSRRLVVLAVFGLAHILLIWSGDILLIYAITAVFMMLLFSRTPVERLWKWALALLGVPFGFLLLTWLGMLDPDFTAQTNAELIEDTRSLRAEIEASAAVYREGSFIEVMRERWHEYTEIFADQGWLMICMVLGYFLLGRWLVVSGRMAQTDVHRRFFVRWATIGLPMGLIISAIATACLYLFDASLLSHPIMLGSLLYVIAGVVLPFGYLSMVTLMASRLSWLAPLGRMALSQYLLQSLVWTTVFYGYGVGLWGQVPRFYHLPLALAFFAFQVVLSHWWLRRFYFGPAEWLWRSLTYWRLQPFRRN